MAVWRKPRETRYEAHYGDRVVLCFADRPATLDQVLRQAASMHGEREALVAGDERFSYRDFDRMAENIAANLTRCGVRPGDRIAVLLGNRVEFAFLLFGALRAGAIVIPLNTREQKSEIDFKIADSGAKIFVHEVDLADRLPDPRAAPTLTHRFAVGGDAPGSEPFDSLLSEGRAAEIGAQEEDVAIILYTSGTTGKPKGAILSHLSLVTGAMHYETCWGLTADDRGLMAVPASHVTGVVALLLAMVRVGGATIFLPAFKAAEFLKLAAAERMTYTVMVPAMYHLCLLQSEMDVRDLASWRIGGYGGSSMPVATIGTLAKMLPRLQLANAYGSTETASPSTLVPLGNGMSHAHTVGLPVSCAEIRIMDDGCCEVSPGESGEVWIKGGQVAVGYWNNPGATRDNFISGFWRSGDIGAMTGDGYLRILDRKKDMINRGGFKVYSAEVESILAACPKVGEAAVVGEPDPVLGERVHAYVFPNDRTLTVADVKTHCGAYLSDYKIPDFVTFIDQPLPRSATGKILKRALREAP